MLHVARVARWEERKSHPPGLSDIPLSPDFFQRERGNQLAVSLDVGRRPDGRPGGGGVGSRSEPAVAAAAVVAPVGLGQLGQVDARPWKRRTSSA